MTNRRRSFGSIPAPQAGMTIIEVLVAAVLMIISISGIMMMFGQAMRMQPSIIERSRVMAYMDTALERLKGGDEMRSVTGTTSHSWNIYTWNPGSYTADETAATAWQVVNLPIQFSTFSRYVGLPGLIDTSAETPSVSFGNGYFNNAGSLVKLSDYTYVAVDGTWSKPVRPKFRYVSLRLTWKDMKGIRHPERLLTYSYMPDNLVRMDKLSVSTNSSGQTHF